MFNESIIKTNLSGMVGWNQPTTTGYDIVDAGNLGSTSGLKFDEGNSLVTIKNVKETQEDKDIIDVDFNTFLDNLQNSCIIDVLTKAFADKSESVENKTLFPYEQRFENSHTPGSGFVGVQIRPSLNKRVSAKISNISVAFDAVKTFKLYLINSQKPTKADALAEIEVTTVIGQDVKFYVLDFDIPLSGAGFSGGNFYLGYFESDLDGAQPYKRDWENASAPILSGDFLFPTFHRFINHRNIDNSGYIDIRFYRMGITGTTINVDERDSLSDGHGINFEYQVYNDWTDLIIQNKTLFARSIQLQMAAKVTEGIMFSTRSNSTQRLMDDNIRNLAAFALNDTTTGIRALLNKEIQNIRKTFFPKHRIMVKTLR